MQNFEKLGAFYLGRRDSPDSDRPGEEPVLYDARDLTTHAMIIGMTGSGKTGLGISLIEEAALDHIPVIAIDPKGDMGNLLLTFPELRGSDFEPWVDKVAASEAGMDVADYAAQTAANWRQGLADWGQQPERIAALRNAADATIYTPGSSAGKPLSVLRAFSAPDADTLADEDRYRERLQVTVTGILTLLGIDADPLQSREHILLSAILDAAWRDGISPDLAALIAAIQAPAFDKIGVMALDTFYPAKDRFALAMQMNSLLAAPGFQAWLEGDALDINRLLYNDSGKPRIAVVSIAHLDDRQRMFFVTMLLNQLVSWMRAQPGSASLRAILYMDEVFGYMPPVANPPSKQLLLTLLKQARAYGLGVVLATQNPVDLDYRGLSNIGTWFIGRLQTERDKARVRDGLQSAAASASLDGPALDRTLASLKKRRFLLHNVHEEFPVILQTRWVMSFLAGPLTRDQISRLTDSATASEPDSVAAADNAPRCSGSAGTVPRARIATAGAAGNRPGVRGEFLCRHAALRSPFAGEGFCQLSQRAHEREYWISLLFWCSSPVLTMTMQAGPILLRSIRISVCPDARHWGRDTWNVRPSFSIRAGCKDGAGICFAGFVLIDH